jgi:hypothetical protein
MKTVGPSFYKTEPNKNDMNLFAGSTATNRTTKSLVPDSDSIALWHWASSHPSYLSRLRGSKKDHTLKNGGNCWVYHGLL